MEDRATRLEAAFESAMAKAREHLSAGDARSAFVALETAHVLGQPAFVRHLRVHARMLQAAWRLHDLQELRGQVFRLCLVPLGHALGRLPVGNTGRSNVSAFEPMPIPAELSDLLDGPRSRDEP